MNPAYRLALAALLACTARPGAAQTEPVPPPTPIKALPERVEEAAGTWDLSIRGTNRRCTLVLSVESGRNGRAVRFPAGCRRSVPLLAKVAGWLYLAEGIRFVDETLRPVLAVSASADRHSMAGSVDGAEYDLVPLQTIGMLGPQAAPHAGESPPGGEGTIPNVAGARLIPGAEPVLPANTLLPPAAAPGTEPRPGTYALDRFATKDVCRVELSARPLPGRAVSGAAKGLAEARILSECGDDGLNVFDPVAWRYANGHITLKARKGHALNLIQAGDGRWRRDPDTGVTFVLRRVE